MTALPKYTESEILAYTQGLRRAAQICNERKRGQVSSDAVEIMKEARHSLMLAKYNHGMTIPEAPRVSKLTLIGEFLGAFLIIFGVPVACWIYYIVTGEPVQF